MSFKYTLFNHMRNTNMCFFIRKLYAKELGGCFFKTIKAQSTQKSTKNMGFASMINRVVLAMFDLLTRPNIYLNHNEKH